MKKRIRKGRIDGKNGRGENPCKGQHREEKRVAVRDHAIETNDADENQKKCTDARSAAKSGGLAELPTERRERNNASTGKNAKYAITQKVAAR